MSETKKDYSSLRSATERLSQALNDWQDLSKEIEKTAQVSPDEQVLQDIEKLIKNIKSKLQDFE